MRTTNSLYFLPDVASKCMVKTLWTFSAWSVFGIREKGLWTWAFNNQWKSSLHLLLISLAYNAEKTWWMFSTCCFLTGQVPSHKLFGSFSKYVSPVPFSPSVCCPEDHQVNMSFKRNRDFCFLAVLWKRIRWYFLFKCYLHEYQIITLNFYHLFGWKYLVLLCY